MKYADGKTMHQFFRALFEAWGTVTAIEEEVHMNSGMTGAQKKNLTHLLSGGPMTISDLAYARGVSRQSVQITIASLTKLGYVQLNDNPRHKQAKLITVTNKGREKLLESESAEHELIKTMFSEMEEEQVRSATCLLIRVTDILNQQKEKDTEATD